MLVSLLGIVTAVAALTWLVTGSVGGQLVALSTASSLILLAPPLTRRDYDPLEPAVAIGALVLLGVTFQAWFVLSSDSPWVTDVLLRNQTIHDLVPAGLVLAVGFLFFMLGYLRHPTIGLSGIKYFHQEYWSPKRLMVAVGAILIVSLIVFIDYAARVGIDVDALTVNSLSAKRHIDVASAEYQTVLGYHRWIMSVPGIAFVVMWVSVCRSGNFRSRFGAMTLAAGVAAATVPILVSSRTPLAIIVIHALMCWWYVRGNLPVRGILGVVGVLVAIIVVGAGLRAAAHHNASLGDTLSVNEIVSQTAGGRNWISITKVAPIVERVPETVDYKHGKTMVSWITAPIPRTWWPDKPPVRVGQQIAGEIYDIRGATGVPPSFPGELYLNFGLLGVMGGMYLFGLALGTTYDAFRPLLARPVPLLVYLFVFAQVAINLPRSDFNAALVNLAKDLVPLAVLLVVAVGAQARADARSRATRGG